jgi:DNA-binding PadR family transcriptional regulator
MARPSDSEDHFRRRLVSLYSLTLMEREGPVHGYRISERIARRTEGAWRPGPGAVYPTLRKLAKAGLVRSRVVGRRNEYAITPKGRSLLARIRSDREALLRTKPDLGLLWAEVMGTDDVGGFLFLRLRRTLDSVEAHLTAHVGTSRASELLRKEVLRELTLATERIRLSAPHTAVALAAPGGGT